MLAYTNLAMENNMEMIPKYGIGAASPVGPYFLHTSNDDAKTIASVCSTMEVEHRDKQDDTQKIVCKIKLMKHGAKDAEDDDQPAKLSTVHTIMYLDDADTFRTRHVKVGDVKKAWSKAGFIAFGIHRQKIKIADGVDVSETEKVHANVCPLVGSVAESFNDPEKWPEKLTTEVSWKKQKRAR